MAPRGIASRRRGGPVHACEGGALETLITGGLLASAALGGGLALALVLATAVIGHRALRRGPQAYLQASVQGTVWRMVGALVGAGVGLALRPASTTAFVVIFLGVYLAGHLLLALRFNAVLQGRKC